MRASKAVLKILTRTRGKALSEDEVLKAARSVGIEEGITRKTLRALVESGRVYMFGDGRYLGLAQRNLLVGRIGVNRRGFGFVETPAGDIYVRATDLAGALHGDTVAVRVADSGGGGRGLSGEVSYVIERANQTLVGRFEVEGRIGVVVPSDARVKAHIMIAPGSFGGAKRGDIVVARLTRHPTSRDAAQGVVDEVVGREGDPGVDIEIIIREHGLRTAFPKEALAEADETPQEVGEPEEGRRDLRDLYTLTVDPTEARDFDDAISVVREGKGFRAWVHIADVSHYVPWGSAVDEEARKRATSAYLVDRVLPMLPEPLSNGICSLAPGVDRFTMTVEAVLDRTGLVESYELYRSVIRSDARLSYDQVDTWLDDDALPDDETGALLTEAVRLAEALGTRRTSRGSLDFETVEAKVDLDEDGRPTGVRLRQRTTATNMIEEMMLMANEVVAGHMVSSETPSLFRIHEDPDPDALTQVAVILKEFDYPVQAVRDASPKTFRRIVEFAHGRPEQLLINSLLLRALKRARYVDFVDSHFGLASEAYTHFTSPIRRYPDLVVHRLLKAQLARMLDKEPAASVTNELRWLAEHSSDMEREADAAEKDTVKQKLAELMAEHIGEVFEGIVTGVASFGFFVQLPNTSEGLVRVEALADDYYRFDAESFWLRGEESGRTYRLGQSVSVRVIDVIVSERRIDMEPA